MRPFVFCFWAASALLQPSRLNAQTQVSQENREFLVHRNRVAAFNTATRPIGPFLSTITNGNGDIRWRQVVVAPPAVRSLSLHLVVSRLNDDSVWELRFKVSGALRDVIHSNSARGKASEAWTDDLTGNIVTVELFAKSPPVQLQILIDKYDYPIEPGIPQGLFANKMQHILDTPSDIRTLGKPVARLRIKTEAGQALCTGFLISQRLLMTNFHCISTDSEAASARADFGFDRNGSPAKTVRIEKLEIKNSDLAYDYVVVRLATDPGKDVGHIDVAAANRVSLRDTSGKLVLIEHPGGGPKMVSIEGCMVVNDQVLGAASDASSDFGHHCDSLGGSSGSPVFDSDTKEIVGLHHAGYPEGSKPDDSLQNQAVYIGYILNDIKKQSSKIYSEIRPPSQSN